MNWDGETTVGEIASQAPAAARLFEKHGIDYCCGGRVPLDQVCLERGLDAGELLAELDRVCASTAHAPADWNSAPLGELIAHILGTHHAYLRDELPRLSGLIAKVLEAHAARRADTLVPLQRTFHELRNELESHMWKEEMVLFPLILTLEENAAAGTQPPAAHCGSVNNPIRVMEHEHDAAGQALAEMRRITQDYALPPEACNTWRVLFDSLQRFEGDMHRHIHLENNILFPRASSLEAAFA